MGLASPVIIQSKRYLEEDNETIIRTRGRSAPMMDYNFKKGKQHSEVAMDGQSLILKHSGSPMPCSSPSLVSLSSSPVAYSKAKIGRSNQTAANTSGLTDSSESESDDDSGGSSATSRPSSTGPSGSVSGDPISYPGANPSHLSQLQADEQGRIGRYVLPQLFSFSPGIIHSVGGKSLEVKVLSPRSRSFPAASLQSPVEPLLDSPNRNLRDFIDSMSSPINTLTLFSPYTKNRPSPTPRGSHDRCVRIFVVPTLTSALCV